MIINHNCHQVSDSKMLNGIQGKLKKVVCEAAPQSKLQVKIPINLYRSFKPSYHISHHINQLSNLSQLYIMMKSGIHSVAWFQVAGEITSLFTLIKVRVKYKKGTTVLQLHNVIFLGHQ